MIFKRSSILVRVKNELSVYCEFVVGCHASIRTQGDWLDTNIARYANAAEIGQVDGRSRTLGVIRQNPSATLARPHNHLIVSLVSLPKNSWAFSLDLA